MEQHQFENGRRDPNFYCDGMCDRTDYQWVIWESPDPDNWTLRFIKEVRV